MVIVFVRALQLYLFPNPLQGNQVTPMILPLGGADIAAMISL